MSQKVTCPNCSQTMEIERTLPANRVDEEAHVFKCPHCKINFITEDHKPVFGKQA